VPIADQSLTSRQPRAQSNEQVSPCTQRSLRRVPFPNYTVCLASSQLPGIANIPQRSTSRGIYTLASCDRVPAAEHCRVATTETDKAPRGKVAPLRTSLAVLSTPTTYIYIYTHIYIRAHTHTHTHTHTASGWCSGKARDMFGYPEVFRHFFACIQANFEIVHGLAHGCLLQSSHLAVNGGVAKKPTAKKSNCSLSDE
jgi:hypothetical protein